MISEDTLTRVVCHSFLILNLFYYLLNRYATNQMVQPHQVRSSQARRRDTHFSSSRWYVRSMERCWVNDTDRTKRWICSWWRWYLYSLFAVVWLTQSNNSSHWVWETNVSNQRMILFSLYQHDISQKRDTWWWLSLEWKIDGNLLR